MKFVKFVDSLATPHYLGLNKAHPPSYNQGMTRHTWPLLSFTFFALILAAPSLLTVFEKRRLSLAFNNLAQRIGLRFYPGGWRQSPRLAGYYHGRSLSVDTFNSGTPGSGQHLRVVLDVNAPAQAYLRLKTRHAVARQINLFPRRRTDDPDFDAMFAITSQPETYANTLLGRRSQLRAALQVVPSMHYSLNYTLEVKAGSLIFEQVYPATNVEQLGATLNMLDDFACAIEQTV